MFPCLLSAALLLTPSLSLDWGRARPLRTDPHRLSPVRVRVSPLRLQVADDPPDDGGGGEAEEGLPDAESEGIADFRAQLMRQMGGGDGGGGGGSADAPLSDRERLMRSVETAALADAPAPGRMLLANPAKFCSRNPFARPVKDLGRFGLDGPVSPDEMPPDLTAQMLPVLLLLEHGEGGSSAVLLERRTGALMGDIDIDSFGCVAIAPLWLGGTQRQNALSALHSVEGLEGAAPLRDGLWLGGWEAARPRVADSSLAAARFKFFLGATTWAAGQLEAEVAAGAWIVVEGSPELVLKERLDGSGARRAKPVWAEVLSALGEPGRTAYEAVYGSGD